MSDLYQHCKGSFTQILPISGLAKTCGSLGGLIGPVLRLQGLVHRCWLRFTSYCLLATTERRAPRELIRILFNDALKRALKSSWPMLDEWRNAKIALFLLVCIVFMISYYTFFYFSIIICCLHVSFIIYCDGYAYAFSSTYTLPYAHFVNWYHVHAGVVG